MTDAVLYEIDAEGIVTITLNRPEMRNPISDPEAVSYTHLTLPTIYSV